MKIVDAAKAIDDGGWAGYQKLLVLVTALSVLLVEMDNQLLGPAIPFMEKDWSVGRIAFGPVLSLHLIGLLFGSLFGGILGDRIGRRAALVLSTIAFAGMTLAIATVDGIPMLIGLRFLSGLGFGGALANAAVLAFEYVPKRQGALALVLTMICLPLGRFVSAFIAEKVLPVYGWRTLFLLCGIIPMIFAVVQLKFLPESPLYLVKRRERWPELIALLRRLGHTVSADAVFAGSGSSETGKPKASIRDLLAPGFRLNTLGLFAAFFFSLVGVYLAIQFFPLVLRQQGLASHQADEALLAWHLAGVCGSLLCAVMIQRLGSGITMRGMAALSIVWALVLAGMAVNPRWTPTFMPFSPDTPTRDFTPAETFGLMVMLAVFGGLLNAVQSNMYALAANMYPAAIRGTGLGAAMAVGRFGNVGAAYLGSVALTDGARSYFASFAIVMALVLVSLSLVRRHIQPTPSPARVHS
jgi:MFS transporter, AAHS family, 4-hydroxybenzoate transporter